MNFRRSLPNIIDALAEHDSPASADTTYKEYGHPCRAAGHLRGVVLMRLRTTGDILLSLPFQPT